MVFHGVINELVDILDNDQVTKIVFFSINEYKKFVLQSYMKIHFSHFFGKQKHDGYFAE